MATDKIQTGIRFLEEMLMKITYIAKKNHRSLTAQHEQMFDLATVKEEAEAAGMRKPSSSQIYYIDLSEGDSAVVYQQEESNLLSRLLTSLNHGIYAVVEYFE